jgi:predicted MPP superfamily phosphohydrolase
MPASPTLTRRQWLKASLGVLAAGVGVEALVAPHRVVVRRVAVRLRTLPAALDGLRIAQLSDLHRGPHVTAAHIRKGAEIATALDPDLIVVTGDFVSRSSRYVAECVDALGALRAPLGVFAVLGNHDYWTGSTDEVRVAFRRVSIDLLVNRAVALRYRGEEWWLGGVDDMWAGLPDLVATFGRLPAGAFRILLAHEPDFADHAALAGVPLQLSGHSHGGQMIIPFVGPPQYVLPTYGRKYPLGLQRAARGDTLVYTNVGLGLSALPRPFPRFRINCPPEVTLLTLRPA